MHASFILHRQEAVGWLWLDWVGWMDGYYWEWEGREKWVSEWMVVMQVHALGMEWERSRLETTWKEEEWGEIDRRAAKRRTSGERRRAVSMPLPLSISNHPEAQAACISILLLSTHLLFCFTSYLLARLYFQATNWYFHSFFLRWDELYSFALSYKGIFLYFWIWKSILVKLQSYNYS